MTTQLRLVQGVTTLDFENIIDFDISESTEVFVPDWVNQSVSIDTTLWNKSLRKMSYVMRVNSSTLYSILIMLTTATLVTLYDYIHGPTNKIAWLTKVNGEWIFHRNKSWLIEIELVVTL